MKIKFAAMMFAFLMLAFLFSFMACGGKGGDSNNDSSAADQSDIKNVRIVGEWSDHQSGKKFSSIEIRTKEGYVLVSDNDNSNTLTFLDYATGKVHLLDAKEKTGVVVAVLNEDEKETYRGWNTAEYMKYLAGFKLDNKFKKGKDKIAGRSATKYEMTLFGTGYQVWTDNATDDVLKFVLIAAKKPISTYEVKEFKVGGNNISDIVNLQEYTIKEFYGLEQNSSEEPSE